jgi:hypothetical protein
MDGEEWVVRDPGVCNALAMAMVDISRSYAFTSIEIISCGLLYFG